MRSSFVSLFVLALAGAYSVPLNAQSDVLIASWGSSEVLRYDSNGNFVDAFVPQFSGGLSHAHGATLGSDGLLYVCSFDTSQVLRFDAKTGAPIDAFVKYGSGGMDGPTDAIFGPDGHLYVASWNLPGILKYDGQTGEFLEVFVESRPEMRNIESFTFGPKGDLFVANTKGYEVFRYDGTTGDYLGVFVDTTNRQDVHTILFTQDGDLLISGISINVVGRYDGTTGAFLSYLILPGNNLSVPHSMAIGPDGLLYVSSFGNDRVLRYEPDTGMFVDEFISFASGGLEEPGTILFMPEPALIMSYGSGINPAGSLVASQGVPEIGTTVTMALTNPLGTQGAGAFPILFFAAVPDAAYPAGSRLTGFGMAGAGATGELLISLDPVDTVLQFLGSPWGGPGTTADIDVAIPASIELVGLTLYAQGALIDFNATSSVTIGLTEALEIRIGL